MDEFLEKLAEDQRRMRKFLRSQGSRFMKIGKALAVARERNARIFVVGEPPLDGFTGIISDEYLQNLPSVNLRLEDGTGSGAGPAPDQAGELEPASSDRGPPLIARHLSRHFRSGDVLLVIAHEGKHPAIKALLGFATLKGVFAILLGGLDARGHLRKAADMAITLPTKGVKTVCEASLIVARILARSARAQVKERMGDDEAKLIRVECGACKEPVFVEERYRGKKGICPLCRAALKVPESSGERAIAVDSPRETLTPVAEATTSDRLTRASGSGRRRPPTAEASSEEPSASASGSSRRGPKKPLKQSVLNIPVAGTEVEFELEDDDSAEAKQASERAAAIVGAAGETTSGRDEDDIEIDDELPPVGLSSKEEPRSTVIAPEDVAFDEFATVTESADPFALPDAFVADLVMPQGRPSVTGAPPPSDANPVVGSSDEHLPFRNDSPVSSRRLPSSRLVSSRFTVQDCRLKFGRGGFPDDTSPEHPLEALTASGLVFSLDPDDDLGSTLEKGDELYVRLSVPAFLEPVLARAIISVIGGSTGKRGGIRIELEWKELDPAVSRKLARAAETLATA